MTSQQLIRIKQYTFSIRAPFQAGHVLNEAEAQALNGLHAENVRNNVSKIVADAVAVIEPGKMLGEQALAEVQSKITLYDVNYKFPLRIAKARLTPIEIEARQLAEESISANEIAQGGIRYEETERNDKISMLANSEHIMALARERVQRKLALAQESLNDL